MMHAKEAPAPVNGRLEQSHLRDFDEDGFVVLRGLFSPEQMRAVCAWTDEVASLPEVPGRHMVYYEDSLGEPGKRILSRIENFCPYHRGFHDLLAAGAMLDTASALLGEPAALFKDKINFKLPGADGFKAHQDVQAGWDAYASLHLTMLISIDEATLDNGCLELMRGAHRSGLLGEKWRPLDDGADTRYESIPTRPGDAVWFDSYTPHRSGPNRTRAPRRVLYVTYNRASEGDSRERYYAEKRASYPPDIERDPGKQYVFRV